MPTIIKKTQPLLIATRREIHNSVTWQVRSSVWHPPTDVYETATGVVVRIEIAGMRDEDLEVAVQGSTLLISGIRSDSTERRAYRQMEIPFGRFSLGVELPVGVVAESANAEYKDGFLTIHVPKEKLDK